MRLIWASIAVSLALVGAYLAAGGASYKPSPVGDPCEPRQWREPSGLDELGQQLALSGIDGAACDLGVSREALARALATEDDRLAFLKERGISQEQFDEAVRAGLNRMVDDAEHAGAIGGLVATGLRALVRVIPAGDAFQLLVDARPLLERALGAGADLGLGGGDGADEGAPGLGERLREGLEGLGEQLDWGLDDLRGEVERALGGAGEEGGAAR